MKDNDSQPFPYSVSSATALTHIANEFSDSVLSDICHAEFSLIEEIEVSKKQVDFLIRATFVRAQHNNDDDQPLPTDLNPDQVLFAEFIKSPEKSQITQTIKTSYIKTPYDTWTRDLEAEGLV